MRICITCREESATWESEVDDPGVDEVVTHVRNMLVTMGYEYYSVDDSLLGVGLREKIESSPELDEYKESL
jgi:hypothetical protein